MKHFLYVIICFCITFLGCNEDVVVIPEMAKAKVRFINGISFTENLRIDIDSATVATTLSRGQYTPVIEITSGRALPWQVYDNSKNTLLFQNFYTVGPNGKYIIFMKGSLANTTGFLAPIPDTTVSPFGPGKAALRFVYLAEKLRDDPALEISLNGVAVTPFSIYSGDYTRLFPVNAGQFSLLIHDEGKPDTFRNALPFYTYKEGKVYTIYTYDIPGETERVGAGIIEH